ncbi:LysR substrate-binding domain-containing protein, partial [Lysobacter sp. 2RAB21]
EPAHPADLIRHRCIVIGDSPSAEWRFIGDEPVSVRIDAGLVSNDGGVVLAWALAGAGIALKSIWDVGDDLAAGRLRRVLPDYAAAAAPDTRWEQAQQHLGRMQLAEADRLLEELQREQPQRFELQLARYRVARNSGRRDVLDQRRR